MESGTLETDRSAATLLVNSPVGRLGLVASDTGLAWIQFHGAGRTEAEQAEPGRRPAPAATSILEETARQLDNYFAGRLRRFDLPLSPSGTPFQREVWEALCAIPYGETRTYGEMAETIGRPKAVRAVGAANGANPIPIVVPCHRVIGADGSLTGYGGGMEIKKRLLALEGAWPGKNRQGRFF